MRLVSGFTPSHSGRAPIATVVVASVAPSITVSVFDASFVTYTLFVIGFTAIANGDVPAATGGLMVCAVASAPASAPRNAVTATRVRMWVLTRICWFPSGIALHDIDEIH